MQDRSIQAQNSASSFVTVLAWIFIALSGFATFISLLQNIMINTLFSRRLMPPPTAPGAPPMPASFDLIFANFSWFFLVFFVISVAMLAAAIGLLRRKNWARVAFIAMLALGIVWNIVGFALQQFMFSEIPAFSGKGAPADFQQHFEQIFVVMRVFSAVMAFGLCALFAWLIKRLISAPIRAQFT